MRSDLVQGNQGRAGGHIPRLGSSVNPSFRVRFEQAIFNLRPMPVRGGTSRGRTGTHLDFGRGRRAGQPWRARRHRHKEWTERRRAVDGIGCGRRYSHRLRGTNKRKLQDPGELDVGVSEVAVANQAAT